MHVVTSKAGGIGCMIGALLLLGTWPAIFNWLERRGRLPQHTFLDYAITNYAVAIIVALTLGQIGPSTPETPNFTDQLSQDNGASVGFALAGGVVLCGGNLAVQYALAYVGLAVAETVTASMTVVGGTTINFFLDGRINRAEILFPGVACFLVAVILGSFLHYLNTQDERRRMAGAAHDATEDSAHKLPMGTTAGGGKLGAKVEDTKDTEAAVPAGTARFAPGSGVEHALKVEGKRAIKVSGASVFVGLTLVCISGLCYILFSPALNLATNDQWNLLPPGVPNLVIYTAYFYFSTAFFFVAFTLNIIFLYFPILGLPKSSLMAWIKDWRLRPVALLAGFICGWGNALQFMGGQAAGYAAADSVQALPLVSTFWGIVLFKEYWWSSFKTRAVLTAMLLMFALAVGLLMGSAGTRKTD